MRYLHMIGNSTFSQFYPTREKLNKARLQQGHLTMLAWKMGPTLSSRNNNSSRDNVEFCKKLFHHLTSKFGRRSDFVLAALRRSRGRDHKYSAGTRSGIESYQRLEPTLC